jgi:hypothetical protein
LLRENLAFLNGSKGPVPRWRCDQDTNSRRCALLDVEDQDDNVLLGNAGSSSELRGPGLMQLNIINAHGNTATTRSNPTAVSQFQCRTTPKATAAAEKRYSARRYRMK